MLKFFTVFFVSLSLVLIPIIEANAALPAYSAAVSYAPAANAAAYGPSGAALAAANDGVILAGASTGAGTAVAVGVAALAVGGALGYLGVGAICDLTNCTGDPIVSIPLSNSANKQPVAPTLPQNYPQFINSCPNTIIGTSSCASYGSCTYTQTRTYTPYDANQCTEWSTNSNPLPSESANAYHVPMGVTLNYGLVNKVTKCNVGYSGTYPNCGAVSPRAAVPDGRKDVVNSPSTGFSLPSDIDSIPQASVPVISNGGKTLTIHGTTLGSDGKPHETWIEVNTVPESDKSLVKITTAPNPVGNTSPQTLTQQTIETEGGIVKSVQNTSTYGQVAPEGTQYTDASGNPQTVQPGQVVLVTPPAIGSNTTPSQIQVSNLQPQQSIDFPTDYARQGEADSAANKIVDKLAETSPDTDLQEPALNNPLPDYLNPLRSWAPPNFSGSCPTSSFEVFNHTYNFDVMCNLFNENLGIIQGAMNVIYAILAIFIVLGA